jgi:hypothetical protein
MFDNKTEEERFKILQGKELKDFKGMVEKSLFEKIFNKLDKNRAMLTEQYRFNESIMKCVNVFYDGKLSLGLGKEQNNKRQHYLDASIENPKAGLYRYFAAKTIPIGLTATSGRTERLLILRSEKARLHTEIRWK